MCSPHGYVETAISYIIQQGYFLPPEVARNNSYMAIDEAGIAHLYIARTTAGFNRIGQGVFSVMIQRSDRHIAKQQEYAQKHLAH